MGYVYYGNYALYYEIGRTECMRKIGISYKTLEEQGIMLPVTSMECKYLRPAVYDDLITIETTLDQLTEHLIIFVTNIFNEQKKLLNQGVVKLCFVDAHKRSKILVPDYVRERIRSSLANENP